MFISDKQALINLKNWIIKQVETHCGKHNYIHAKKGESGQKKQERVSYENLQKIRNILLKILLYLFDLFLTLWDQFFSCTIVKKSVFSLFPAYIWWDME